MEHARENAKKQLKHFSKKSSVKNSRAAVDGEKKRGTMDTVLLILIFVLLAFGIVMVFSASYPAALAANGNSFYYITKHVLFVAAGIVGMFIAARIDYHVYRRFVFPLFIIGIILLILVLVPGIGTDNGTFAKRWINLRFTTFQPSEIMKFAIIVMFSHLIALNQRRMNTFVYGLVPFGACLLLTAGLMMLEPHLSGTILIFSIGLIMMFIGGTKIRYFAGLLGCAVVGIVGIIVYKGADYVMERVNGWLNPFAEHMSRDETWQTIQSLVAIGSGGLFGRGIGNSRQKFLYLPEAYNDYIFAVICEELGLIGALLVIVLFVMFALRGFAIAAKAPDTFGYMMGIGLTSQVCIQAVLNMAVVTNTIPSTGISLPFFSYGGTAIVMLLWQMGVLLNISRQSSMEKT